MIDLQKEIRDLEKEAVRLERKRQALMEKEAVIQTEGSRLENLFESSGFKTPKALVDALILKFRVQPTTYDSETGRRRHVRINKALRDTIKADLDSGVTVAAASRRYGISYTVVSRVAKGLYAHLG